VEDKTDVEVSCLPDDLILYRTEPVDFCTLLPSPAIIVIVTIFVLLLILLLVILFIYACYRSVAGGGGYILIHILKSLMVTGISVCSETETL
jgi:hypothetical protein